MIELFCLSRLDGVEIKLTNYGARLISLVVPGKYGVEKDIVWGFKSPEDYKNAHEQYFGATIGRYANRISNGKFNLDGINHQLEQNNSTNHLHGGKNGFHNRLWEIKEKTNDYIIFSYFSKDGEAAYPGNVSIEVKYELTKENGLKISYQATTDKPTPLNLTHHSYFNLTGNEKNSIDNHILKINADYYTPVNENLIPLGHYERVAGSPFDFRSQRFIGDQINSEHNQILRGNGYDHNFVLKRQNSKELILAAEVFEPISGRMMQVITNQPGLQFYTANWLNGKDIGKNDEAYQARSAFCLETQHFPDSPNQTFFPSCIIKPEEIYDYSCEYRFVHL